MAKLYGGLQFTGKLGGLSAYTLKGTDQIILRGKGGLSKKKVQRMPVNSLLRRNHKEWGGCVVAGKLVRRALHGVAHLADHNISGPLNGLAKQIQKADTHHPPGERPVLFSGMGYLLTGFNFNRYHPFDSIVRYPLTVMPDRNAGQVQLQIPALAPVVHLQLGKQWQLYRFCLSLGLLSDVRYDQQQQRYAAVNEHTDCMSITGSWQVIDKSFPGELLELQINPSALQNNDTAMVVCLGIERGQVNVDGVVETVPGGAAKVMAVG